MITWLVAGGLVAIPILIHLFNRTRYRKIQWAAMEFLLAAYKKTRRRVQVEHLLLLALRALAMLFLAFAFFPDAVTNAAKSTLDTFGISFVEGTNAGKARHLFVVIDDTFSMRYQDPATSRSSFDRARDFVSGRIAQLKDGRDQVTLIPVTSTSGISGEDKDDQAVFQRLNREIQALGVGRANEQLSKMQAGYGRASLLSALREATRRIASNNPEEVRPELVVVSDFQANAWKFASESDGQHAAFRTMISSIDTAVLAAGGTSTFHDAGPKSAVNFAIRDLRLVSPVVGVGIPARIEVALSNSSSGNSRSEALRLQYRIDGGEAIPFDRPVKVAPGSTESVEQDVGSFNTTGARTLRVEIVNQDTLAEDNARSVAIRVIEELPILIINGAPNDDPQRDEVATLVRALDINAGEGVDAARVTPNRIEVKTMADLTSTPNFENYAIIFLCNAVAPPPEITTRLEEYVGQSGGTLVVTLGDNVVPDDYNNAMWREGEGILPARIDTLSGVAGANSEDAQLYGINTKDLDPGSPLEDFNDDLGIAFIERDRGMRTWFNTEQNEGEAGGESDVSQPDTQRPTRVSLAVAKESAESPLFLDRPYGAGKVLMWTSSIDGDWQDYWSMGSLIVLYIMHDVVRKTATTAGSPHLAVGESFVRVLTEGEQTARGNDVEFPSGTIGKPIETTLADGRRRVSFSQTGEPGVYSLRYLVINQGGQEEVGRKELFTVGVPEAESDILRLGASVENAGSPDEELSKALQGLKTVIFDAAADDEEASLEARAGEMDIWILFVGMAAFMLLAEMGTSLWFNRSAE